MGDPDPDPDPPEASRVDQCLMARGQQCVRARSIVRAFYRSCVLHTCVLPCYRATVRACYRARVRACVRACEGVCLVAGAFKISQSQKRSSLSERYLRAAPRAHLVQQRDERVRLVIVQHQRHLRVQRAHQRRLRREGLQGITRLSF